MKMIDHSMTVVKEARYVDGWTVRGIKGRRRGVYMCVCDSVVLGGKHSVGVFCSLLSFNHATPFSYHRWLDDLIIIGGKILSSPFAGRPHHHCLLDDLIIIVGWTILSSPPWPDEDIRPEYIY